MTSRGITATLRRPLRPADQLEDPQQPHLPRLPIAPTVPTAPIVPSYRTKRTTRTYRVPCLPTAYRADPQAFLRALAVSAATTDPEVGQSTTVTAVATFSNGTTGATTVTWESDNVNVATVSQERQVRAVGPGTATIIGRSASGPAGTVLVRVRAVGPRTRFGSGSHRVGADIAAGRYFSAPVSGCYWERVSGFGGTLGEIIANDFVGYNPSEAPIA